MQQRLAGPHGDAPEAELHPLRRERRLHEVVVADGGAADRDEDVGRRSARALDAGDEGGHVVAGDAEIDDRAAGALDIGGDGEGVGGDDLVGADGRARQHEFVAGGKERDTRLAHDGQVRVVHRGGEGDLAGPEPPAGL